MNDTHKNIKLLAVQRGTTLTALAAELGEIFDKKYTASNFVNKLRNNTLLYREVEKIAEILDYEIVFVDKRKKES